MKPRSLAVVAKRVQAGVVLVYLRGITWRPSINHRQAKRALELSRLIGGADASVYRPEDIAVTSLVTGTNLTALPSLGSLTEDPYRPTLPGLADRGTTREPRRSSLA